MLRYHSAQPENTKGSYTEYDSVDFVLTFEGRKLAQNSIRLEADLDVHSTGATRTDQDRIFIDNRAGAHVFAQPITTELQSQGVIENLQEHPRHVRMVADATVSDNDMFNSENVCELRAADRKITQTQLRGVNNTDKSQTLQSVDFSIKPRFCLNLSDNPIPCTKTGSVRLNVKLSRNFAALCGEGMQAGSSYVLRDLKVSFVTVPDDNKTKKVSMSTKLNIKQAVNSAFANVSTKVPAVCNAVSCSFLLQSQENQMNYNNVATQELPNIQEAQFLFNDSQNEHITYSIKGREELLYRHIQSFADVGSNDLSLHKLGSNNSFGLGIPFRDFVDLSNQKFNVQVTSEMLSTSPHILFMHFHSVASI